MNPLRLQGVLVNVNGLGVLLRGPSGIGKSSTALRLMDRGHKLVSDDLVEVTAGTDGRPVGRPVEDDVRIEIRGLGIFSAGSAFPNGVASSSTIDIVIDLDAYDPETDSGRVTPEADEVRLLGINLPQVRVPVATGADVGLIIELVAKWFAVGRGSTVQ
jgi:HPr kinase/phosphorylase